MLSLGKAVSFFSFAVSVSASAAQTLDAKSGLTMAHGKFQLSLSILCSVSALSQRTY